MRVDRLRDIKLCACGCNQYVTGYYHENGIRIYCKYIHGHNQRGRKSPTSALKGPKNPGWKGGRVMYLGYWYIWKPDHPYHSKKNYVQEHRLVMEKKLGRYLEPNEKVHHINRDKTDNREENLVLFDSQGEHTSYHNLNHRKYKRKDLSKYHILFWNHLSKWLFNTRDKRYSRWKNHLIYDNNILPLL